MRWQTEEKMGGKGQKAKREKEAAIRIYGGEAIEPKNPRSLRKRLTTGVHRAKPRTSVKR
jgi:hypothetical protein